MTSIEVIMHCSKSTWGNAVVIDEWHRHRDPPFLMIGYHMVFLNGKLRSNSKYEERLDGLMETGRPYGVRGAHTLGQNYKIGWCFIGMSGRFTPRQIEAAKEELRYLATIYDIVKVTQHSDYDPVNKAFCAGCTKKDMMMFNQIGNGYGMMTRNV